MSIYKSRSKNIWRSFLSSRGTCWPRMSELQKKYWDYLRFINLPVSAINHVFFSFWRIYEGFIVHSVQSSSYQRELRGRRSSGCPESPQGPSISAVQAEEATKVLEEALFAQMTELTAQLRSTKWPLLHGYIIHLISLFNFEIWYLLNEIWYIFLSEWNLILFSLNEIRYFFIEWNLIFFYWMKFDTFFIELKMNKKEMWLLRIIHWVHCHFQFISIFHCVRFNQ